MPFPKSHRNCLTILWAFVHPGEGLDKGLFRVLALKVEAFTDLNRARSICSN